MDGNPLRLLLVEDNPGDARLIQEMLVEANGASFQLERVKELEGAMERLGQDGADLVLLDLGLPDSQGLETFLSLHARFPQLPIIVLTGLDDQVVAIRAAHAGAQDYLIKGQIEGGPLARAVRYAIERKRIEEELKRAFAELERKTAELESFSYSVSHDLKEPLRTLEAFSQFLLEDYAERLDDQGRDYLRRIGKASGRLKQMIEELLVLSRVGQPPEAPGRVDLGRVLAEVVAALEATIVERGARVIVAEGLPEVAGERGRIEQVFGNLITNGLKFNRSPQTVVEIGVRERDEAEATLFVRDNGIGIAPEYHEQVFGVFQRLHRREEFEGTGAGLAIVRRAAEAMGGRAWVESEPGAGATFLVRLPLWQGAPAPEPAQREVVDATV